ncbi:CBS domain-containing membrane protein [Acidovorax sp. 107]|uniref:HPP family protein n=1 Tax=Acidovorax sp. 107 TaxID=2135638 RepID=UPI000D38AC12|nr:HPP family protein [Acidovorax sp. 107]PUA96578.1 CBS domain-containing membrane protein [Acidovorax sp. 107]
MSSSPPDLSSSLPSRQPLAERLVEWLRHFWPAPLGIDGRERLRFVVGAVMGMLLTAWLSRWWAQGSGSGPWMVASLGASAVLVFGMPSSPLAQPWPVLGGSTLSALVGAVCSALIPDKVLAGAIAVGLAIALMVPLRCLHPPGGAMALYVVLTSGDGWHLAAFPVLFNVVLLLIAAVVYNGLTGRRYPHPQRVVSRVAASQGAFTASDVDAALAHYNQVLDVSRADLEGLLHLAGRAAFQRTLGELRCADIMSSPPHAVEMGVSLKEAWALMRLQQIKALPVVDTQRQVIGIVTVADFMRLANLDTHEGLGQRLRTLVMGRGGQPQAVGEIMSHPVQVARATQHAMDLVPLFSQGGHHHIPIVDDVDHLVGIITQTDLVRTLATAVQGR